MMRFLHTVRVDRSGLTHDGLKPRETRQTVYDALPCLIESLSTREIESLLGRLEGARYRMSWKGATLEDGDRVLFNGDWHTLRERHMATGVGSRAVQMHTAVLQAAQPGPGSE